MNAQTFALVIGAMMITAAAIAWRAAYLFLTEGREARKYKALIDEDRAHEIALTNEVQDLTVQFETSDLDAELAKILKGGLR